jgi:hypothetical protein
VLYGGPELAGGAPRVSSGIGVAKTPFLSITGNNREPLRRLALQALEVPAVVGHLQQGGDLHLAGELGVGHVVGVRAQQAGTVHPEQEVGTTPVPVVQERRLVDNVGAGVQRIVGELDAGAQLGALGDLDDRAAWSLSLAR